MKSVFNKTIIAHYDFDWSCCIPYKATTSSTPLLIMTHTR